ncbi:hypothetical protein Tco_0223604 [Tanacetum coccineum]
MTTPITTSTIDILEDLLNISSENKAHYDEEKEAIHLLLTGIGDEIYSTVDACKTAHDIWIAIERLQQGESLNIQDVKTSLFWEFGRFTSRDGESIESYYFSYSKKLYNLPTTNSEPPQTLETNTLDTTLRYVHDNQTGQFGNQRTVTVAGARETECRKPKRAQDYTYHKEKMLLYKQAEKGLVHSSREDADWW